MKIEVFQKNNIFSTRPHGMALLPKTFWKVIVYPTFFKLEDLLSNCFIKVKMNIEGPVEEFRVFLNLAKGQVLVQGFSNKGFFRYRIFSEKKMLHISFDKCFTGFSFESENNFSAKVVNKKKIVSFISDKIDTFMPKNQKEILFLGSSKKQDIDLMDRRSDMREILPPWYLLAQYFAKAKKPKSGICSLFDRLEKAISNKKKDVIEKDFIKIYRAGFSHLLTPRLQDDEYQGIIDEKADIDGNPVYFLEKGFDLIRNLFFKNEKNIFYVLPCLPTKFHCGKLIYLKVEDFGTLSLEWSKKLIKKMIFNCKKDFDLKLELQSKLHFFRIKMKRKEKGRKVSVKESLFLEKGKTYFFDRFQK